MSAGCSSCSMEPTVSMDEFTAAVQGRRDPGSGGRTPGGGVKRIPLVVCSISILLLCLLCFALFLLLLAEARIAMQRL